MADQGKYFFLFEKKSLISLTNIFRLSSIGEINLDNLLDPNDKILKVIAIKNITKFKKKQIKVFKNLDKKKSTLDM